MGNASKQPALARGTFVAGAEEFLRNMSPWRNMVGGVQTEVADATNKSTAGEGVGQHWRAAGGLKGAETARVEEENVTFDDALGGFTDIKVETGRARCRLQVAHSLKNRYGTLHGGAIATAVDIVTSAAIMTLVWPGGMSVDLAVSYMAPAPVGVDVIIEAEVDRVGRTLAFSTARISNATDGKLLATGRHIKFVGPGLPPLRPKL